MSRTLLSTNKKLEKSNKDYLIMGLNLAPHKVSGYNTCPHAGKCAEVCIGEHSGFMRMNSVRKAQVRKTKMFFEDRKAFLSLLHKDLQSAQYSAVTKSKYLAIRLNIDSDIPWESIDKSLFKYAHAYYDYTKNPRRMYKYLNKELPEYYYLTFSFSEKTKKEDFDYFLKNKGNIAVIFNVLYRPGKEQVPLPKRWGKYKVVDGDVNDLRTPDTDGRGVIVGLRAKMKKDLVQKYVNEGLVQEV